MTSNLSTHSLHDAAQMGMRTTINSSNNFF